MLVVRAHTSSIGVIMMRRSMYIATPHPGRAPRVARVGHEWAPSHCMRRTAAYMARARTRICIGKACALAAWAAMSQRILSKHEAISAIASTAVSSDNGSCASASIRTLATASVVAQP